MDWEIFGVYLVLIAAFIGALCVLIWTDEALHWTDRVLKRLGMITDEKEVKSMLDSHSNPQCAGCKHVRVVGCGTKLVEGRRTHITLYNCYRDGTPSCSPCEKEKAAPDYHPKAARGK